MSPRILALVLLGGMVVGPAQAEDRLYRDSREQAHPYSHLEGRRRVDDSRLREMFDRAVSVVVREQAQALQVEAQEEVRRRRLQRRAPVGARDINDIEPSHIPSVVLFQRPLS